MLKKIKLSMPQAVVVAVGLAAFAAVYIFAPEDRDSIEKGVLGVWALVSTLLPSLFGKNNNNKWPE